MDGKYLITVVASAVVCVCGVMGKWSVCVCVRLCVCSDNYDSDDASIEEEGKPLTQDELRTRLGKKAVRMT